MATANERASAEAMPVAAGVDLHWLSERIDYRRFQECIHCGLCTASCPTYVETGNENDGPRGRIYLMKNVVDGRISASSEVRKHLELCLDCRACESACPSGVQYGRLIEPFKVALAASEPSAKRSRLETLVLHQLFPFSGRLKAALAPVRLMQRLGLWGVLERTGAFRILPGTLRRMQAMLPRLAGGGAKLPERLPPQGPRRAKVALFLGCVADAMYPETNAATARVLARNGCEVVIPRGQTCCGAIHYHSGAEAPATALARANMDVFLNEEFDAIITNAAGCGAMLKDYGHLPLEDRPAAQRFAAKVKDISEFLAELGPIEPRRAIHKTVTYHDACHLCHAQKVRDQPRRLLAMIPGLTVVPLEESELCCGAAGTYNLTQPEMSARLAERKLERIKATGAAMVVTGNVGCLMQISRAIRDAGETIDTAHPIDLLDRAYGDQ